MRNFANVLLLAVIISSSIFSMNVSAVEIGGQDVDISVDAGIMSTYVWRGILLTDDPVLQPGITVGAKGISLNVWSNMDLGDVNGNDKEFNELDFTLDYSYDFKNVSLSAGIVRYTFPNTNFAKTTELYFAASSSYTKGASLIVFKDIAEAEGIYSSVGYDYGIAIGDLTSIDISGALSFGTSDHNAFYYGSDSSGLTDLRIGVSAPFALGESSSVTPGITFTSIMGSDIIDVYDAADIDTSNIVFGVTFSAGF